MEDRNTAFPPADDAAWADARAMFGPQPEAPLRKAVRRSSRCLAAAALAVGAGFALCFTECTGFGINAAGFTLIWMAAARLALGRLELWNRRQMLPMYAAMLLMALSVAWTQHPLTQMVSMAGVLLLMCLVLLCAFCRTEDWGLGKHFTAVFCLIFTAPAQFPAVFLDLADSRRSSTQRRGRYILLGLLIAVPLCALVLWLLGSADPVFGRLLHALLPRWEHIGTAAHALFWTVLTALWFYGLLAQQARSPVPDAVAPVTKREPLVAVTFTGVLCAIYLVFCAIQVVFLFAGLGTLPEGMTYAAYAREGFFQLLFVSTLNVALVIVCIRRFASGRILRLLLTVICACTYVLIASSAYRMLLYVGAYGLTYLRLLVLWFLLVLTILMSGTLLWLYRPQLRMFRFAAAVCTALWLVFAWARPDALAVRYDLAHFDVQTAEAYALSSSSDALIPALSQSPQDELGANAEYLQSLAETYTGRQFNFSVWQATR